MGRIFYDHYLRPPRFLEENSGEVLVETEGYLPADVQILQMMNAGVRLEDFRKGYYDFDSDEEVPDDFVDPTRTQGFDLADASNIIQNLVKSKSNSKVEDHDEMDKNVIEEEVDGGTK